MLPELPAVLRPDLPRGQGQGPRPCCASRPTTTGWSTSGAATPNGRLIPLIIIPLWDAAAGRRRGAPQRGPRRARGLLLRDPAVPGPAVDPPDDWDPFFAACEETGDGDQHAHRLVVEDALDLGRRPAAVGSTLTFGNAMSSMVDWLMSGVLVRFPDLKLAYSEGQIGWIPYILERADKVWEDNRGWDGVTDKIPDPPSSYYYGQIYGCFFDDPHGLTPDALERSASTTSRSRPTTPTATRTWPHTARWPRSSWATSTTTPCASWCGATPSACSSSPSSPEPDLLLAHDRALITRT